MQMGMGFVDLIHSCLWSYNALCPESIGNVLFRLTKHDEQGNTVWNGISVGLAVGNDVSSRHQCFDVIPAEAKENGLFALYRFCACDDHGVCVYYNALLCLIRPEMARNENMGVTALFTDWLVSLL